MSSPAFFSDKSIQHSRNCFLNSLLREWSGFSLTQTPTGQQIEAALSEDSTLIIPLRKHSALGRHLFAEKSFLRIKDEVQEIDFFKLADLLCERLATDFDTENNQIEIFKARLVNSVANIEASLQYREADIDSLQEGNINFIEAEQGLMIGHNFHPTPKSRDQFSDEDLKKYSPEFGGHFSLHWFMASPSILHQRSAVRFEDIPWTTTLANDELAAVPGYSDLLANGYVPMPMHPWQAEVLLGKSLIQQRIEQGLLVDLGRSRAAWYATSSLRTVYRDSSPFMLKFSMSVRLTNSVRHLLPHEVERGLQLYDVMGTKLGIEFLAKHPQFHIIGEPAYISFTNDDDSVMIESIVVCRENPFSNETARDKIVLATLAQDSVLKDQNLIQYVIANKTADEDLSLAKKSSQWFQRYLEVAVKPFILAEANYGIILGAHQQNLIIGLKDGYPAEAYFRDCQGTGYSEIGFDLFAKTIPSINRANGNVVSEKIGNYLFVYYLILNSTFNVITAISSSGWITEEELLKQLNIFLTNIYQSKPKNSACLEYLLFSPELMHKGNFICSFKNINENTITDPLAIYTAVKNSILLVQHD